MAYSDTDLLNIYTGFTYGISSAEVKIQGMTSADQLRLAKIVEANWNAVKTDRDAKAIDKLAGMHLPLSAGLLREVNQYDTQLGANENAKTIRPAASSIQDTSPISLTSSESKNAIAQQNGGIQNEDNNSNDIVIPPTSTARLLSSANVFNISSNSPAGQALSSFQSNDTAIIPQQKTDRRARLSPRAGVFDQLITGSGIMSPLRDTYGLMFPITPTISENVEVNYEQYDVAHSLMPIQAYKSGGQKTITVDATFIAQTDIEARYCLACIHFIRSFSKMNFGDNDPNAGTPPPVLVFNAYGEAMYNNIPVVISNANFTWPNDVDYVYTTAKNGFSVSSRNVTSMVADGWVPSRFSISLTLTVQHTPSRLRKFNLASFRNGNLLTGNGGWI